MICNLTKKTVISRRPFYAVDFISRGRGMIGRDFRDFDAMVFERCNCIHTMFMSMKIDVLFVDRENRICGCAVALHPWLPFVRNKRAATVIELPEGTLKNTKSELEDILDLNAELSETARKRMGKKDFLNPVETAIPFNGKKQ